jgi:hypothetical protein
MSETTKLITAARTTYGRATAGYDPEFEAALMAVITAAITEACFTTDANALALRTGEIISALVTVLSNSLALTPERSPTAVRKALDQIAKQIKKQTNAALADPDVAAFYARAFHDGDAGGTA